MCATPQGSLTSTEGCGNVKRGEEGNKERRREGRELGYQESRTRLKLGPLLGVEKRKYVTHVKNQIKTFKLKIIY